MGRKSAYFILLFVFFLLRPCQSASAADWYIVPKIEFLGEYDSNVNWSFVNKAEDYVFNVSPSVEINYESEISKLTASLIANGQLFVNNPNLDVINQYYLIGGRHKVAPRFALTFDGSYTSDATLREELFESGTILNRTRREAIRVIPGVIYDLSPRAALALAYGYNRVTYQDPQYNPYYRHEVISELRYGLGNQKTTLIGTVSGRYTGYYTIGNIFRTLGTYAGLEHKFSEEWILNLAGGLNYNWYSTQTAVFQTVFDPGFINVPLQATQNTFDVSPYFNIAATRRWPKTDLNVGYYVNQAPSSSGVIRQYHRVNADITHRFWEKLRASFGAYLYYGFSSEEDSQFQNMVLTLSPIITYQITEKLSFSTSYNYGLRNDIDDNITANRHRVSLFLTYAYPIQYKK